MNQKTRTRMRPDTLLRRSVRWELLILISSTRTKLNCKSQAPVKQAKKEEPEEHEEPVAEETPKKKKKVSMAYINLQIRDKV